MKGSHNIFIANVIKNYHLMIITHLLLRQLCPPSHKIIPTPMYVLYKPANEGICKQYHTKSTITNSN